MANPLRLTFLCFVWNCCLMFCTLSLSSRWSTLTLHSSISVLEPKIWLPGCWSTTLCKDCPSRESCITPGWWSAPPRSQQPWTTKSHQNEPFGSPPPNVWGWSSAEHWLLCAADLSKSAYMPTTKSLHVYVFVILSHFVTFFLPFFFFFWSSYIFLSYQWHIVACKYFTVFV